MGHSNSSLNCFTACQRKYQHNYVLKTPPCKPVSPHLTFGTFAHDVLYKAGVLRDCNGYLDSAIDCIPSEVVAADLKEFFKIKSWYNYFTPVCKKVAEIEKKLITALSKQGEVTVEREVKISISPEQCLKMLGRRICEPLTGIIDLLLYTKDYAIIIDYKFSSSRKDQDDFDMNSQLPWYAMFVHLLYKIPFRNIQIGYIDIPKTEFDVPTVLSNGTLSRAKSQNTSQEMYIEAVRAIHDGEGEADAMLAPGGYYYDIVRELALKQPAYLSIQYLDLDMCKNVINDMFDTIAVIELCKEGKLPYLAKYDAYTCKGCEYLTACKPWLSVNGGE